MNKVLSASLALDTCSAWGTNRVARLSQTYKGQHFGVWTRTVRIETMDRPKFLESKNRCERAFDDLQILGGIPLHHTRRLRYFGRPSKSERPMTLRANFVRPGFENPLKAFPRTASGNA
jgi:hypothetical protein